MNTLADRIKQRLSDLDKTQADLAKYCKVKPPSVSKWLSGGTKTLQGQNLLRASEFLECDPDWLASGKGFWADTNGNANPYEAVTSPYTVKMLGDDILGQYLINMLHNSTVFCFQLVIVVVTTLVIAKFLIGTPL